MPASRTNYLSSSLADLERELPPPVHWEHVSSLGYGLARSASAGTRLASFERFLWAITGPLRKLDALHELALSALAGNPDAVRAASCALDQLARRAMQRDLLIHGKVTACAVEPACGCAHLPSRDSAPLESPDGRSHVDEPTLLNELGLSGLLLAAARLHRHSPHLDSTLNAVMDLVNSAGLAAELFKALVRAGDEALAPVLAQRLASLPQEALQSLDEAMRPMSMTMDLDFGTDVPGLPGLPGVDQLFPKKDIDNILATLRGKKRFDPDHLLDPNFVVHRSYDYVDYWNLPFFRCVRHAKEMLADRAKIPPPNPPVPVTWALGISSITASHACAGATVVIRGTHLSIPGAVLLVPFADGCHVVPVDAGRWTDSTITFTLPAGAISGPVGFGDGAYIKAYDVWADQQNQLADQIRALNCLFPDMPWVSPFRQCPPDLGVNHIQAGAAIIDAFTANGAGLLVLESDAPVTLAWVVRNAIEVRISQIGTLGPFPGGFSDIVNPVGTSLALGNVTAGSPSVFTYRLVARGPCGEATQDVQVVVSRRPKLSIQGIEITQGIQTIPASLPYVVGKPIVVRVTVRHGLNGWADDTVPHVVGRLRVRYTAGGGSAWFDAANGSFPMAPNPGTSITVRPHPQRSRTDDTLNFLVPLIYSTNLPCLYAIEVRVSGFGAIGPFAGFDDQVAVLSDVCTFETRKALDVRYGMVNFNNQGAPTAAQCVSVINAGVALLPTPAPHISALPMGVRMASGGGSPGKDKFIGGKQAFIDQVDDEHNCSFLESFMPFMDCPDDDGAYWAFITGAATSIGGLASDIPGNCLLSDQTTVIFAHEMAHCLNQRHVNTCGASGGDSASAWNNGYLNDFAFDPSANTVVVDATGRTTELMTYCNGRWPAPQRWDALFNYIGP
ncbi:MAG TPA: hypothetical protein VGN46_05690 [Luteibacter sp.]|uniref:hypothetical protein n=1 Tax=Luteibacter sp. TaxID=1886636 RepID=UPI002F42B010